MTTPSAVLNKLHLALFAGASLAALAAPAHAVTVVVTPASPINITNSIDGIYINLVTGAIGSSGAAVPGWDINPYNNGSGVTFYGAASPSGVLASGTPGTLAVTQVLAPGSVVGPTLPPGSFYNQFQTTAPGFQSAGDRYVGLRFLNESTGQANYGYMLIRSGASAGFPASIVSYGYENAGLAVTVGAVPEPSSYALLALGIAAIGGVSLRRRRAA